MRSVEADTLGAAWLAACRAVLEWGEPGRDGAEPIRELLHLTARVRAPDSADPTVARLASPEVLAWMKANFCEDALVPELGNAPSYGHRLRGRGRRDQVAWVVGRLRAKPETKSATVTTLLGDDAAYVPCVSLLDFKLRRDGLLLTASCRSLDVGVKMPANLVELARLQHEVAAAVGRPVGELVLWVVSAHVYDRDLPRVREVLAGADPA